MKEGTKSSIPDILNITVSSWTLRTNPVHVASTGSISHKRKNVQSIRSTGDKLQKPPLEGGVNIRLSRRVKSPNKVGKCRNMFPGESVKAIVRQPVHMLVS